MKKKKLLKRIEELESENAKLKSRIEYLEATNKPSIIYTPYYVDPSPPAKTYEITCIWPYKITSTNESVNMSWENLRQR